MKSASSTAKHIFVPAALIAGAVFVTIVMMWLLSKSNLASRNFDFHFFDTYFIVSWTSISIPLFLLVTFILFFTGAIATSSGNAAKAIALVSGIFLFLIGSLLISIDVRVDNPDTGWMALPPGIDPGDLRQIFSYNVKPVISLIQIILLFALIFLGFKWGKDK